MERRGEKEKEKERWIERLPLSRDKQQERERGRSREQERLMDRERKRKEGWLCVTLQTSCAGHPHLPCGSILSGVAQQQAWPSAPTMAGDTPVTGGHATQVSVNRVNTEPGASWDCPLISRHLIELLLSEGVTSPGDAIRWPTGVTFSRRVIDH